MTGDEKFEALLRAAERFVRDDPDAGERLRQAREDGHPLVVALAHLLHMPVPNEVSIEDVLARRYRLTLQERRVAAHLIGGGTVESCADTLGIAQSTVRSHLKMVFQKTGVRRQGQLASLLLGGLPKA